jgi:formate dehydrogenase subunit gamma
MRGCPPWDAEAAARIIEGLRRQQGAALPILRALQEQFGYVDKTAVPIVADALNVSKAEVHGIISFYHDFRSAPVDADVLKLCRAESCQAMGCEALVEHLAHEHRIVVDEASRGQALHVETVYCLGNCALSPAALLNGDPIGRLDPTRIDSIVRDSQGAGR